MPPSTAAPRRSAFARIASGLGAGVGLLIVFVLSVVGGVLLHLNTAPVRRAVAQHVNAILAPTFKGSIRLDSVDGLGLWGVSGANVTISDPKGHPVIVAHDVHATLATWTTLKSVLFGKRAPFDIRISYVAIDSVEVRLDSDPDGNLYLVDAFDPPHPSPSTPPDPTARALLLELPHIAVKHAWAHGQIAGAPSLDADVDDLSGGLTVAPDRFEADVAHAKIIARKIANGADVVGDLQGRVIHPIDVGREAVRARGMGKGPSLGSPTRSTRR